MRHIAIAIALAAYPMTLVRAQGKQCSREEAMQAEATAAYLITWPEILGSFKKFGHCDDGAIAEGYSISIVGMLADRWSQVADLDNALATEPRFRTFVLGHVDESAERDAFNRLVANAAVRCPPQFTATCEAILGRARELQRELQRHR